MMEFTQLNLNSVDRQKTWADNRVKIRQLLLQIKDEVFEGEASIKQDHISRFSGLSKPNLTLGPTSDLRGFIGICVSPKQADRLRVLVSNGHTASRYDVQTQELEKKVESALSRWLSQPMYNPKAAVLTSNQSSRKA
jgi:hypothetical protein